MTKSSIPRPSAHLGSAGRKLHNDVLKLFELEANDMHVLDAACIAADRAESARIVVERDGILTEGRYGPRTNPAVLIERDSRAAMLRALTMLGLNLELAPVKKLPSRWRGR